MTAAGGQLQRFLESEDGLRLLDNGGYGGATMTEGGFLVLHSSRYQSQEMVAHCDASAVTDVDGFRVGACCWTVVGNASAPKKVMDAAYVCFSFRKFDHIAQFRLIKLRWQSCGGNKNSLVRPVLNARGE